MEYSREEIEAIKNTLQTTTEAITVCQTTMTNVVNTMTDIVEKLNAHDKMFVEVSQHILSNVENIGFVTERLNNLQKMLLGE